MFAESFFASGRAGGNFYHVSGELPWDFPPDVCRGVGRGGRAISGNVGENFRDIPSDLCCRGPLGGGDQGTGGLRVIPGRRSAWPKVWVEGTPFSFRRMPAISMGDDPPFLPKGGAGRLPRNSWNFPEISGYNTRNSSGRLAPEHGRKSTGNSRNTFWIPGLGRGFGKGDVKALEANVRDFPGDARPPLLPREWGGEANLQARPRARGRGRRSSSRQCPGFSGICSSRLLQQECGGEAGDIPGKRRRDSFPDLCGRRGE